MICKRIGFWLALVVGFALPGWVAADDLGNFTATKKCSAPKSIKTGSNPGNVKVQKGKSYPAFNLNKPGGSYVQVEVKGAKPPQRWVRLDCGKLDNDHGPGASTVNLLSLSWQPAFCETKQSSHKPECDSQTAGRFDEAQFTLHGLWPQPQGKQYCGVSSVDKNNSERAENWRRLPEPPGLISATRSRLDQAMPGTASFLHRHEWFTHGTCFGPDNADPYFRISMALQEQINNSQLQRLMAANIGKQVTATELANAFEQTFGPGSAQAMEAICGKDDNSGRTLLIEFRFKLKGDLAETTPLGSVLDTSAIEPSCSNGFVDQVGYQ